MQKSNITFRVASVVLAAVVLITLLLSFASFSFNSVSVLAVGTSQEFVNAIKTDGAGSNNQTITLTADIDLSGVNWSTIANYSGTFDGNHHILKGVNKPLFNTMSGTVRNVGIVGNTNDTALLAKSVTGTVENCYAYGAITHTGGAAVIGGLIGELSGSAEVLGSFTCVDIVVQNATINTYVGGFIGSVKGGSVESCYSTGTIDAKDGYIAGFANKSGGSVTDTYTSCQLKNATPFSKASGVNGLYDNQLGLAREEGGSAGLSTKDLMMNASLSNAFSITSTAYPALHAFYSWSHDTREIVKVSIAAAAFSDVVVADRMEPTFCNARADYLTDETYIDRTNVSGIKWTVIDPDASASRDDSENCKIYDTVPVNNVNNRMETVPTASRKTDLTTGVAADLLRAKFVFTANVDDLQMVATTTDGYVKHWFISSRQSSNPYFSGGNGKAASTAFTIASAEQLDYVRYYSMYGAAQYKVIKNFEVGNIYPIVSFNGVFDGQRYTLSDITVVDLGNLNSIGLFANTTIYSTVKNITLHNVNLQAKDDRIAVAGALIGIADETTVTAVQLKGNASQITTGGTAGGLIGKADYCTLSRLLVSIDLQSSEAGGGIVGVMVGGTLQESASTGIVQGDRFIGGLVGKSEAVTTGRTAAAVTNCYSTASVISDYIIAGSKTYAGGLIGDKSVGTLSNSYAASYVYAPNGAGVGALVGNGTLGSNCYFDANVYCAETTGTASSTKSMVGTASTMTFSNASLWKKAADQYPQIAYFANTTNFGATALSLLSTTPVYFQQYWDDAPSENMTTGWIGKTFGPTSAGYAYQEPVVLSVHSDGNATIYDVDNVSGWGFEADGGTNRLVLKAESDDVSDIGIRTFGAMRPDMRMVTYEVTGARNINTYVEIYYSSDRVNWQGSQLMSVSGAEKVIYDIPDGSYVKVRVACKDDYKVASVKINNTTVSYGDDGYYTSTAAFTETDIAIVVSLAAKQADWGVRRESY